MKNGTGVTHRTTKDPSSSARKREVRAKEKETHRSTREEGLSLQMFSRHKFKWRQKSVHLVLLRVHHFNERTRAPWQEVQITP